ncbi:Protein of unknown function [Methylomagnum ishizawai]|uniref:DUF2802 domain-containing protein n=1 Tax=Methylomagnum ishizawai TaxID=1760988 RepID=A0A1Y6CWC7_9GAMM|nr:DUF2802 domain-containing protein [Methylomagnum ishizawai]SMF94969.1 Protein of unknown function [Methylomagnum ishizawai]
MNWLPYFALLALSALLAAGLFLLARAHRKLARDHAALAEGMARQGQDLMGLCAAAVQVDRRVFGQEERLRECLARIEELATRETTQQPYYTAIDKVKAGARPEELVAEFGLSLSEANLLVSLYGQPRR